VVRLYDHVYHDVVVIGMGLAGMVAASVARAGGRSVEVIADGLGAVHHSTGCLDLWDQFYGICRHQIESGEGRFADPWKSLAYLIESRPDHPYSISGLNAVRKGIEHFRAVCEAEGFPYVGAGDLVPDPGVRGRGGASDRNLHLPTALGRLRSTYLGPLTIAGGEPGDGGAVLVVGIDGLRDFFPALMAEGLRSEVPGVKVEWISIRLPAPKNPAQLPASWDRGWDPRGLSPVDLAYWLEDPGFRSRAVERLIAAVPSSFQADLILIPAVLGIDDSLTILRDLERALGARVAEIPMLPPSVPGLRLSNLWKRHLLRQGIDLNLNARVTGAGVSRGLVGCVYTTSGGRDVCHRAEAFVLASGGLVGNGLVEADGVLREPVFDLPVAVPERDWTAPEFLVPSGHPFARLGVRTGPGLRPAGYDNLYLCGRILGGYDPTSRDVGTGWPLPQVGWRGNWPGGVNHEPEN
ncbi:MAG: anaerobic glycerol-3-phosphate dehydrogenase subunit GlpB, partial [Actinobacteria bacterium]|nr:anaerobic glycerol-3-phosphate dehydrogenase subunit GlpB [Actinomycetota bacterium]